MTLVFRTTLATLLAFAAGLAVMSLGASAQANPEMPYRLIAPMVASDGTGFPNNGDLPAPDPTYCPGNTGGGAPPTPPNSVFGLLSINGQPAPAGTIVQLVFDGKLGPAARTAEAGGYRVDYAGGHSACANKVGAEISVLVNGQLYPTGKTIGGPNTFPLIHNIP